MNIISTSEARTKLPSYIDSLNKRDGMFVIGRRNKPEVILIKYPENYDPEASEMTNLLANSGSFDFLKDEPDLYSFSDLKKKQK